MDRIDTIGSPELFNFSPDRDFDYQSLFPLEWESEPGLFLCVDPAHCPKKIATERILSLPVSGTREDL